MTFLVPQFEVNGDILLGDVIGPHMSESRAQLAFYDVCVVALRGHCLGRQAIGDKVVHNAGERTRAPRKYLPQLPVQFFFRRIDATKPNPLVLADVVQGRTFGIDVSRQLFHW
jgi:hypothetical protein